MLKVAIAFLAFVFFPVLVFAHAVIDGMQKPANTFQFVSVRITHGCGESPTHKVTVKLPDGLSRVSPRYKHGWSVTVNMRKLDEPVELHGQTMSEAVDSIVWEGGTLPDGMYDTFEFRAMMPHDEGGIYRFPTVQECDNGESIHWDEVPAEGQSPWELEEPAPFITLTAPVRQYQD